MLTTCISVFIRLFSPLPWVSCGQVKLSNRGCSHRGFSTFLLPEHHFLTSFFPASHTKPIYCSPLSLKQRIHISHIYFSQPTNL